MTNHRDFTLKFVTAKGLLAFKRVYNCIEKFTIHCEWEQGDFCSELQVNLMEIYVDVDCTNSNEH